MIQSRFGKILSVLGNSRLAYPGLLTRKEQGQTTGGEKKQG